MKEYITDLQKFINKSYQILGETVFNISTHKFHIKQEIIAKSGLWVAKKRYALWVVNKEGVDCNEMEVKGIDVVRSDFPISFKHFMEVFIRKLLEGTQKESLDKGIRNFRKLLIDKELYELLSVSTVKELSKFDTENRQMFQSIKGTPIHVKSGLFYNDLLKYYKETNIDYIKNGQKLKWCYLTQNEFNIEVCGLKGFDDSDKILTFVKKFIDIDKMVDSRLLSKIEDFYTVLGWSKPVTNDLMNQFFN